MPPPAPSHTLARRLLVSALLAVGAFALDPGEARADCAVTAPNVITCAPPGTGGFGTGVEDGQTITVNSDATLSPVGIDVRDNNVITVDTGGTIDTTGAGGDGIAANDGNTIVNNGTITVDGAGDGIQVGTGDADRDTVDVQNNGTINVTGNGRGIAETASNTIVNGGVIELSGDNSTGIEGGASAQVTNAGIIRTPTGGGADGVTGIRVGAGDGDPMTVDVLNTGTIGLDAANAGATTIGIDAGANNIIQNDNSVRVTGPDASPNAIAIRTGGGDADPTTAEIVNNGSISAAGQGARAIVAGPNTTIVNDGTIRTDQLTGGGGTPGAAIDFTAGGTNNLINRGDLFGVDGFDASNTAVPGTAILGGGGADTIENRGSLFGDVDLGAGDDVFDLRTSGSLIDGDIEGGADGGGAGDRFLLQGNGGGRLDFNQTAVTGFETLEINADPDMPPSGTAGAGVWDLDGTATFTNAISLNAGTLQTDTTVRLNGGAFTMAPGTGLTTLIDPLNGTAGQFSFAGAANLNGTLGIAPLTPLRDADFTVVHSDAGLAGAFVNTPQDTALLRFIVDQTANDVILRIRRNSYASVGETDNQRAVGRYLDRVLASREFSASLNSVLLALDDFEASQFPVLLDAFHPEAYDAHTGQTARIGRMIAETAIEERPWCKPSLYGLRPAQRGDVPCGPRGWSAWMRALTGFGKRDSGSDFRVSRFREQGIMGGVDWRVTRNWLVSMFGGITSTDIHVNKGGEGDLDTFEIGMAGTFRYAGARAKAAFGYGRGDHKHDRQIDFFGINPQGQFGDALFAEGDFNSNRILALFELSWVQAFGNFHLEPVAAFDVTWIQEDDISESGASSLDLRIAERENTLVATSFGGRFFYRHFQNPFSDRGPGFAHGTWTPELTVKWRSIWTGADRELESRFRGAAARTGDFTIDAQDTEQGLDVGVHLLFQPHGSGGGMSIGYDGHWGDGGLYHSFGAKLRLFF